MGIRVKSSRCARFLAYFTTDRRRPDGRKGQGLGARNPEPPGEAVKFGPIFFGVGVGA